MGLKDAGSTAGKSIGHTLHVAIMGPGTEWKHMRPLYWYASAGRSFEFEGMNLRGGGVYRQPGMITSHKPIK